MASKGNNRISQLETIMILRVGNDVIRFINLFVLFKIILQSVPVD